MGESFFIATMQFLQILDMVELLTRAEKDSWATKLTGF